LHFINEDIILIIPVERRWILEVYGVEAAFLNVNPRGHMYIKIPDEIVELGFMTTKDQEWVTMFMNYLLNKLLKCNTGMVVYGDNQGALHLIKCMPCKSASA